MSALTVSACTRELWPQDAIHSRCTLAIVHTVKSRQRLLWSVIICASIAHCAPFTS